MPSRGSTNTCVFGRSASALPASAAAPDEPDFAELDLDFEDLEDFEDLVDFDPVP
jgi:hypothetical protein